MNNVKILIGSTLNNLASAKKNGKLCLTELYILNIIDKFIPNCNNSTTLKLQKIYRDIQTAYPHICNIRNKPAKFTFKFNNININNFFQEMATFNININAQTNLPPSSVGDGSKTTPHSTTIIFTRDDFTTNTIPPYADPEGDNAKLLKILSLPAGGTLKLNNTPVVVNQIIDFADIDLGNLTYSPDPANTTARVEPFTFSIADAGSLTFTS
jgi:hypothetical protein